MTAKYWNLQKNKLGSSQFLWTERRRRIAMTLYQLKIFEAVARHLNITQASLELHASQPAVSKQLKLLEENFRAREARAAGCSATS